MPARDTPVVSVIIPTYNRVDLLATAVDSVLQQSFSDWELILADDGSDDETQDYLNNLADPRVRLCKLMHTGVIADVRNAGAAQARGDWLAFLDSDDQWLPGKLKVQLDALSAAPDCGWSYTNYEIIDVAGKVISTPGVPGVQEWHPYSGWILKELLQLQAMVVTPSVMVKRVVFHQVGGYDRAYAVGQDYDLYFRLGEVSPALAVNAMLARIRKHAQHASNRFSDPHQYFYKMYAQAMARSTDLDIIGICRRQCALRLIASANLQSQHGNHRLAFDHLRRSMSYRFPARTWSITAAKCARRAFTRSSSTVV
jgi:glycosyltransferase involved in cell wall biosynthesis